MTELSGYVFSALRKGEFTLYRGSGDGLDPILLVAPIGEHPARESVKRLEHEHDLKSELNADWAVRPVDLSRHDGRMALVLEDPGGEPLDQLLGQPMDMTQFLRIAIPLAAAIGQVHIRGLIHKNLKPANILVDVASDGVWLTGFGIASRLPRERQAPAPPEIIAGTLAYMAPEQTGRMNRSIDARSDLYSLGITFYEMLTGTLPFTAADPMEWVHCHIARQPVPPEERVAGIPRPLAAIVMKLLTKTAEDRYQTAAGVEADLRHCLAEWQAHSRIEPFSLAAHDVPDRLVIPEKLYGREAEINTLLAAFDRVVTQGKTEFVLVSGYAGIGKSSIINELHKVLVLPRGLFAAGKFDQYKRDIPYATLAQAFQSLVRQLLSTDDAELSRWRNAMLDALGPNGQLMINLIPELALIIGEQPPVPDLPPQDRQTRFQLVFRRLLGVFARPEHPLALFLDDLQWLDAATLSLLDHLITHSEVRHLLLIGAYRDNEVGPSHPLMPTLEMVGKSGAMVRKIALSPLMPDDIGRLIADSLHCEREIVQPLAQLVQEKTDGNPFFAVQFFTALAEEGLLTFDHGAGAWNWDMPRIRAKGFTDNVAELMAEKIGRLPPATREALGQLACLGNVAEIATLALVHGESVQKVHEGLWEAVRAGLVFRLGDGYAFLHDRVQEAAYTLIPESERADTHLRIGRSLASRIAPDAIEDVIFDVVNHLNRGAEMIAAQAERDRVAELNLMAGKRAQNASAYASALKYFIAGAALVTEDCWERRYDLAFALELRRAECEFLIGDLAAAEARLSALSRRTVNLVDEAAVTCLRMDLYFLLVRPDRAVDVCLEYLRRVGIEWSPHPNDEEVRQEYERIWRRLGSRAIEDLIDLPLMCDPETRATMDVFTKLMPPAFMSDENLACLMTTRMVNLSLEQGNANASCCGYVWLGLILGPHFGDYPSAFRFGQLSVDLVEKRGLDAFAARVYLNFGNVNAWMRDVRSSRRFVESAFQAANKVGDLIYAGHCWNNLVTISLASGESLSEAEREATNGLDFARKLRFGIVVDMITGQLRLIRMLRGLTNEFSSFNDAEFDQAQFEQHLEANPNLTLPAFFYWVRKLQARVWANDYSSALGAAAKAQELLWSSRWFFEHVEYHFYAGLARAAISSMAPAEERAPHIEALAAHYRQLEIWAQHCPANFGDRKALLAAEIARLEGYALDAERLYEEAIRLAGENRFTQNEALANEHAARFYAARGFEIISDAYLRNARDCCLRWGADGKVRQLDELYPKLREKAAPSAPTATIGSPAGQLDVATVLKASQAVSGEIELDKLIETLMGIAIEHAGAERGLLILLRGGEPRIMAEATTSNGRIEVSVREMAVNPSALPQSALHYVMRTRESVVLDDASVGNLYSNDEYVRQNHPRSVLCLPVVKQTKLVGALYLENNLTPYAFTSSRVAVLELLASQAAISLENARLYSEVQRENTDRKRAEEELRRSEAYLAEAQRLSRTGSFGWNVATGEIIWSEETFRIFDHDKAPSVTVNTIVQRTHPDDRAAVQQTIDRAARDGKDFSHEYRLLMPDGSVRHVQAVAHAVKDASGNVEFVGAVTNVTSTKQAYEALERSEQRYRRLFHHMPVALLQVNVRARLELLKGLRDQGVEDVIAYLDQNPDFLRRVLEAGTVEDANQRAVQMLGARDTSQLIGSSASFYWEESPATFRRSLESRFRGELTFQEEGRFTTLDGRAVDVLITIARSDTSNEAGINLVGLIDISERVRAQEMLQRVQADLAHVTRVTTLGELTASIAHEVNQPLAAIVINGEVGLQWLDREMPDLAEVREALHEMISNGRRGGEIIQRLRALSKRTETQMVGLDINEAINEVIRLVRQEMLSRRVSLRLELAPALPAVLGDRVQLQQVIINLIVNGMEWRPSLTGRACW
ncbi:AAA family ATPase [Mesorhizobium sp. M1066]|uniref:trifunctional serine/threonine-protein kinase/ATP-binding protein/sensor histidine kinase n=1 Tax=unclassified Mesorhizobium TaxID=325217 RepID=UPI003338425D